MNARRSDISAGLRVDVMDHLHRQHVVRRHRGWRTWARINSDLVAVGAVAVIGLVTALVGLALVGWR